MGWLVYFFERAWNHQPDSKMFICGLDATILRWDIYGQSHSPIFCIAVHRWSLVIYDECSMSSDHVGNFYGGVLWCHELKTINIIAWQTTLCFGTVMFIPVISCCVWPGGVLAVFLIQYFFLVSAPSIVWYCPVQCDWLFDWQLPLVWHFLTGIWLLWNVICQGWAVFFLVGTLKWMTVVKLRWGSQSSGANDSCKATGLCVKNQTPQGECSECVWNGMNGYDTKNDKGL